VCREKVKRGLVRNRTKGGKKAPIVKKANGKVRGKVRGKKNTTGRGCERKIMKRRTSKTN